MEQQSYEALAKKVAALESEIESYRLLVDNSPDLLYRTDLQGRITFVSSSVQRLSGYTVEEAIGMKMAEEVYFVPEERNAFLEQLRKEGRVSNFEARLKRKDGSLWWASTNAHFHEDTQGRIIGVEGITRDISELKAAEKALLEREELFRLAFQTSPDSINLNRASDGMYIDINEGFTNIMGYSRDDAIGRTSLSLDIWRDPRDRKRLVDGLKKNGYVENLEAEFIGKDGRVRVGLMSARLLEINNEPVILSITRDITERKRLEQQLLQSQKFEALGTLAGGVAHDFNNLLMGIQGRASLIGASLDSDNPLQEHAKGIEEYVRSAANLTGQLLGFARGGKYEIKPIDVNELLRNSAAMFGRTRKEIGIHIRTTLEKAVVEVDGQQIEQVFLNIFVNAWQAMPEGGELFLETSATTLDRTFCRPHRIAPGRYCRISISDTGIGMDDDTRRRIFDPFFTTKEKGRGTGLGLASAWGIIKNHGGVITVYSELKTGTTFNIYLPLSDKASQKEILAEDEWVAGTETVLLVDDEQLVIDVGKAMLEKLGYSVIAKRGGQEAIDLLNAEESTVDIIILDLVMPGMDGARTFDKIRKVRPRIPVILSSGYSINGQASDILEKGCEGFIQKPFNLAELARKLRQILDEPNRTD